MKYKTILIATIIILFFVKISFATTLNIDASDLKIVAQEVSPEPVEPGQDVTLKIRLA